jgi:hypothetical protein
MLGIGGAALAPALSGAAQPPQLPPASVHQLVREAAQAPSPAFSGTLTWSTDLGLSDLSSLQSELGVSPANGGGFNPVSLLSGDYHLKVWVDGAKAEHVALITGQESEVDVVRNGSQIWLWDSSNQSVLHLVAPAKALAKTSAGARSTPSLPLPTPSQLATSVLAQLTKTTSLTVGSGVWVAGQPAYQLLVSPKGATGSTVRQISIAIGSKGQLAGVPLQVAVYAKGVTTPALELGFSSITPGAPPAGELSFVAPPGSHVVTRDLGSGSGVFNSGLTGIHVSTAGHGWATVAEGTSSTLAGASAQAQLGPLTSPVRVGSQQARLFSTYLLNVLFLPDGRYYAGFVGPAVLEAAASQAP